jgi:hypothetical protein
LKRSKKTAKFAFQKDAALDRITICINPSTYGDLIPTSYCDVRRFPAGYLNLELNFAGVYAN